MIAQPVTINLPEAIYERLKERAEKSHSTIEDELLQVVAASVPARAELDPELNDLLLQLSMLDDQELWRAARSHLAREVSERIETLHLRRQREGLSITEEHELETYIKQYERAMLTRAQAAVLLHERGYDVSNIYETP